MDIYSLRLFLSVAETLNFTKTAQEYYLTQPVVSRRVQELEAELGCQLFSRSRHGVRLTPEGEIMYPIVKQALNELDIGIEKIRQRVRMRTQEINLAAITPATNSFLPSIIGEFSALYPKIDMNIVRMTPGQIRESLKTGSHDIYISMSEDLETCREYKVESLKKDCLGLIMREREVCDTQEQAFNLLRTRKLLEIPREDSPALYLKVQQALSDWKIDPKVIREIRPVESLMFNIASGVGVSVMPENIVSLHAFGLKFVPLKSNISIEMKMAWHEDAQAHVRTFVDLVLKRMKC